MADLRNGVEGIHGPQRRGKGEVMAAKDPSTITRLPDGRFGVSQDNGTSQAFSTEEELRVHLTNRFGHSIAEDLIRRVKGE